jgi:DNA polymerase (family 10)
MEKVIQRAAQANTAIEINSNPDRLDLDWRFCRVVKREGARVAINPDAHHDEGLSDVRFGINVARKGWIEKHECLNCMGAGQIEDFLNNK